jgi:hypothetical protein
MNNKSLESLANIDPEFADSYEHRLAVGAATAKNATVAIVAICRDVEAYLPSCLARIDELAACFSGARAYIFENDSTDETPTILRKWQESRPWATVESTVNSRPRLNGFENDRTVALAEYRNKCLDWVRANSPQSTYTVVLDMDGHWFVSGAINSIGWLAEKSASHCDIKPAGMASYSLVCAGGVSGDAWYHYDAWAARLNWWSDRKETMGCWWFHLYYPPVGSPPVQFNSAFGGLAVYLTEAYLAGHYSGGDCEHVPFHQRIARAGYKLWLNPSSRFITNWIPQTLSEPSAPAGIQN